MLGPARGMQGTGASLQGARSPFPTGVLPVLRNKTTTSTSVCAQRSTRPPQPRAWPREHPRRPAGGQGSGLPGQQGHVVIAPHRRQDLGTTGFCSTRGRAKKATAGPGFVRVTRARSSAPSWSKAVFTARVTDGSVASAVKSPWTLATLPSVTLAVKTAFNARVL